MSEERLLLYGANEETGIVAIENLPDRKNVVQVYSQGPDGTITSVYDKFDPFIYLNSEDNVLRDVKDVKIDYLLGTNPLNVRISTPNVKTVYWLNKNAAKAHFPMMGSQYQIHSGKTLFKGLEFDNITRLYLDIETITTPGFDFPNADRPGDRVVIISMTSNKGDELVLHGDDEKLLLKEFLKEFRRIDPTVVVGHNSSNFDLPYLESRFAICDLDFALGRNGAVATKFLTSIKLAEKNKEYWNWNIWGRHVMDTMFMAMQWDVVQRTLSSYGLKDIIKTLGLASADREYVEGKDISKLWTEDRERLLRYALDDVKETKLLDEFFAQPYFYMTQMVPMSYQDAWRYGTGTKIDTLFIREYYRRDWSLPLPEAKRDYGGGYADSLAKGMVEADMISADVKSLYPTISKTVNIQPKSDELFIYQPMMQALAQMRFRSKTAMQNFKKQGMTRLASIEDAKQNSQKIFINTGSYGYIGWEFGTFNDFDEAERITVTGQSIIKKMVELAGLHGSSVKKVDTDGMLVTVPLEYIGSKDSEEQFVKLVQTELNEWFKGDGDIEIEHDGRYRKALIVDDKSYVLLGHDDKIKIKGNTLRSRSMEPFARLYLDHAIREIMLGDAYNIREEYDHTLFRIMSGLLSVDELSYRRELNQSLEEYKNKRRAGANPIAQYELAVSSTWPYRKGDRVTYYISTPPITEQIVRGKPVMRPAKLSLSALAKESRDYANDYWVDHYVDRFNIVVKRLLVILGEDQFRAIFPDIKLKPADIRKLQSEEDEE